MEDKRVKEYRSYGDRLSQLPDEIIIPILSQLSLKVAGSTSALSSRWLNAWKNTPHLNFEDERVLDKIAVENKLRPKERGKYVQWVNAVLRSHETPTLSEFSVCFDLDESYKNVINKWLKYAFAHQVQRLELDFMVYGESFHRYDNGNYTFLEGILNMRERAIDMKSLKALSLKCVDVSGKDLEFILGDCPFLEQLVVWASETLEELEVSSPTLKLKHLEIRECHRCFSLKVRNINLKSLSVARPHPSSILLLENLLMLVEVSIASTSTDYFNYVFGLLSCLLSQLETMTLWGCKPKELVKVIEFPELPKLKKLVVRFWADRNKNLLGLVSFIKAAPLLEEFDLELAWHEHPKSDRLVDVETAERSPHQFLFLKIVRISGYFGRTSELELVKYFLGNAVALERIIVDPRRVYRTRKPLSVTEIAQEESRRDLIKQQLEGQVPEHIKLVIL